MIYVNSTATVLGAGGMSPGNALAPQATSSTSGKLITPKEMHSFMRDNDLSAMGWKITKGSLYRSGYQQVRSADGEFEMQYQLSGDDLDALLRYDGQMSIKLYLGYASQTQLSEPSRGIFDVYLRIPEAIARERLQPPQIPPATPGKPYLVVAYRMETYMDGATRRLRMTSLSDMKPQVVYGNTWSPEITIKFKDAGIFLNGNTIWNSEFGRTDINIPEGAICIRSAPDPLSIIAIQDVGISVLHEPSAHTLSPDDDGATIYAPYVCQSYGITIPDKAFPKGFSVALSGQSFSVGGEGDVTLTRKNDFYPFGTIGGQFTRLTQTGDDGKTWVLAL
ncbi:hypothetical protein J3N71_004494 [Salmonella enterica subsp. enterica serovar Oranienburg]|nr:hypothetical protein [Salmonella enterica subsp. enterica serovar Oranienburg]